MTGAFSDQTGTSYPSWDALVHAEANGYVVTAIVSNGKQSWPWSQGPYDTKTEATKAQARMRYRLRKEKEQHPGMTGSVFVRPLWKERP